MLISDDYRTLQSEMHKDAHYGFGAVVRQVMPIVAETIQRFKIQSLLDYGAGKCALRNSLAGAGILVKYHAYDPAFPGYGDPVACDLLCCIDVLEHIEPEFLPAVLEDLHRYTKKIAFVTVHVGEAHKFLSDGRNTHLIQERTSWWLPKLSEYFETLHLGPTPGGFWCLLWPRDDPSAIT